MPEQANRGSLIRYVPNTLSIMRLLLALVFPTLPQSWWIPAIITGGLSDVLDGYIARRFHVTSRGGGTLDGVADKLFVLSALATITFAGHLAWWAMALLLARDAAVGICALDLFRRGRLREVTLMQPSRWGKIATLAQYAVMLAALLWRDGLLILVTVAAALSLLAAGDYLRQYWVRWRAEVALARVAGS